MSSTFIKQNQKMQNLCPSEKIKKLDKFIIGMPVDTWYTTKNDPEIIQGVKDWIDGKYLWPKEYLELSKDFSKFRKKAIRFKIEN